MNKPFPISPPTVSAPAKRNRAGVAVPELHAGPRKSEGASTAEALNLSTRCPDCGGKGKVWFIALDSTRYQLGDCQPCDGTGLVEATCETCSGKLIDGWCADCQDYGVSGWALAERSAYGMAVRS
jgi:hypothetical protein